MDATSTTSTVQHFNPDRYVVPLGFTGPGHAVGSGFWGMRNHRIAFYTAAHNVGNASIRGRTWRIDDWSWLISELPVYVSAAGNATSQTLQVFAEGDRGRISMFNWLEPASGVMCDAVRFGGSQIRTALDACAGQFDIVNLDAVMTDLTPADELVCVGFPLEDRGTASWPYFPPARREGSFLGVEHGHILANFVAEEGLSGGPVFTANGSFVGILTGNDRGIRNGRYYNYARIVTAQDVLSL